MPIEVKDKKRFEKLLEGATEVRVAPHGGAQPDDIPYKTPEGGAI